MRNCSKGKSKVNSDLQTYHHSSYGIRHCSNAVLSMADYSNVVGEVASTLAEFTSRWVQSGTWDLNITVASTINHEWARIHKPVLSTKEHHHVPYTKSQASQPEGKLVICHCNCGVPISSKARKTTVVHTSTGCESKTSTPFIRPDKTSTLGQWELIKMPFPQEQYPT